MNNSKTFLAVCSVILFALFSQASLALETDRQQPINIEADRAEFDRKEGTAVYLGNVVLQQGSLIIYADKIALMRDQEELQEAIAYGSPARFQQQINAQGGQTKARSLTMKFDTMNQQVTLLEEAFLQQDENEFTGDKIIYDTETEKVSANGLPKTNKQAGQKRTGRIKLIIQPRTQQK